MTEEILSLVKGGGNSICVKVNRQDFRVKTEGLSQDVKHWELSKAKL